MKIKLSLLASVPLIMFGLCSISSASGDPGDKCKQLYDDAQWKQAIPSCTKAAKEGELRAQTILGELYDREGNAERTAHWWNLAAESGDQEARNLLAMKLYYGGSVFGKEDGWEQDYGKAFSIWKQDAVNAAATSQYMIGLMYFKGQGMKKNMTFAWFWLNLARTNGYVLAKDLLIEVGRAITPAERHFGNELLEIYNYAPVVVASD